MRVVASPDRTHVVPDPRRTTPGRGAWIHLDGGCLRTALDRKAFPRALRMGIDADVTALHALVADLGDEPISPA